jgi:hypothetical protein
MARSAQMLTNPSGDSAPVAPWTAATNTMTQASGSFTHDNGATSAIAAQSSGAYDFYQDVAIPGGSIAAVDAGLYAVDYDAYGAKINGGTSMTMTLKALNGVGAVLTTWSQTVSSAGKPYTQFTVRMITLPVGTRTVRAGWSGTAAVNGDAWFDDAGLYFNDVELAATKFNGYAVAAPPASNLVATKFLEYAVEGAGIGLTASKFIAYGVLGEGVPATTTQRIHVTLVCRTRAIP